ncbi:MAG: GAF domain-containing protein [Sphingomonas sp.]|jgi:GAF domain-containing protein|nr:MAG: GAF domain-containing protein [Sphingomonas sp.]
MIERLQEARRLAGVDAYGLMDAPPSAPLDAIAVAAAESAAAPMSMISVVGRERQWFAAAVGIAHRETPIADSICAHAIRSDETFVVSDLSADERFRDMTPVQGEDGIRFYAGTPLVMNDGVRLGTLCVVDVVARDGLDGEEQQALEALARRTVAAMELRRDLREGRPDTRDALVADAARHLSAARAALELVGCTAILPHLEHVVSEVEALATTRPDTEVTATA